MVETSPITLHYDLTDAEIAQTAREGLRDSKRFVVTTSLLFVLGVIFMVVGQIAIGGALMGFAFMFSFTMTTPMLAKALKQQNERVGEMRTVIFSDDGIEMIGSVARTSMQWSAVETIYLSASLFMVKIEATRIRLVVPMRLFPTAADATNFQRFVEAHLTK